jgi:hypothetical protein
MAMRLGACVRCAIAAYLACGTEALAQAPVRKIRQKMSDILNSTPDFICSVSIERTERMGKDPLTGLPALHVNAGIVNGKELYALPGTDGDQALLRKVLALYGRAGTGAFAMYARAVFLTAAATFYDGPEEAVDGRTLSRLDFAMPREVSHYVLSNAGKPVEAGYWGSIWTDPHNLEVARLMLQAGDLPPDLGIKAVTQTVEYGRTHILGLSALLPAASDLTLQEVSGRELRITAHFSDCHYFAKRGGQFVENRLEAPVTVSSESMAAGSPETGAAATASVPVGHALPSIEELLPAKTPLEMMLEDPIDERSTTVGSKLSFTVLRDIKKERKVILPRGATAMGHVTRILRQTYSLNTSLKGYYAVGLQLDTMEVEGRLYRMWANLERVGPPATQICFVPFSHNPLKWGEYDDIYQLFIIPDPEPGESFLGVVSEFLRLGSHWRTDWTVVPLRK